MKKILVPVDFSEQSINAFRFAIDIAARSRGHITLLHVLALPVLHDSTLMPVESFRKSFIDELTEAAHGKFDSIIREYNTDKRSVEQEVVTSNDIHTAILQHITKGSFDLVVMGTKGASGVREWVIGSNTEKIVRTSPAPVISVKDYHPGMTIKNIVFPNTLDTENQEELIMRVKLLQDFFQATLHIAWINTPAVYKPDPEIRQRLKDFANRFMLKDYTINVFSYSNEETGILEFTRQINGDLIAMGTHGHRGLMHFFSGSVAEDVVNHVPYPVWTWRTRSAIKLTPQK